MKAFTELYSELDQTTKTNEKVNAMVNYFNRTNSNDSIWAIALLTGRRPKRPIKTADMKAWATELAGIPYWLFEESYDVVGDLAETISLLIPIHDSNSDKSLSEVMDEIIFIQSKTEEEKKKWLLSFWSNFTKDELFVFNKLITGSFRVGVSQQLIFKALAKTYSIDDKVIAHKLMGSWLPQTSDLKQLLSDESSSFDDSKPYPFYLAYQLDVPFTDLGSIDEWQLERKYDGIRGQIIVRNNSIHIWSRGEELMTDKFIEFTYLKDLLPNGTVLDGEVLPFKDNKIMSFNEMQKRIGRKNVSKKTLTDVPLCMMCYDLLESNGGDIRKLPLLERRKLLDEVISKVNNDLLKLSPLLYCDNWENLDVLRNESKQLGCEGLMLKHKDSIYETGRRRGKWWKWKVDPYTVDAVLIYAQSGHGRRANLYTDYTFAIWDKGELVPFTKAYSGLTDKELLEVDNWIKRNTIEKFGPVRSVKAELVFEIAFEGINASPRHKSGIALRFPRILRWRKDKKKEEINTKEDLLQLLNSV
ncbi:MAG: ATP-dependent DNA ligase [Bacteroidetes bacterium]|nr:ATP-dependent DNA ligase [Bacteroidota bacterium]